MLAYSVVFLGNASFGKDTILALLQLGTLTVTLSILNYDTQHGELVKPQMLCRELRKGFRKEIGMGAQSQIVEAGGKTDRSSIRTEGLRVIGLRERSMMGATSLKRPDCGARPGARVSFSIFRCRLTVE